MPMCMVLCLFSGLVGFYTHWTYMWGYHFVFTDFNLVDNYFNLCKNIGFHWSMLSLITTVKYDEKYLGRTEGWTEVKQYTPLRWSWGIIIAPNSAWSTYQSCYWSNFIPLYMASLYYNNSIKFQDQSVPFVGKRYPCYP
jgi:hypothetical protein